MDSIKQTASGGHELRKYPNYEDSGSEWVGKVPRGWKLQRLKYVAMMNRQELPENTPRDYSFKYFDIGSIESGGRKSAPSEYTFENAPSRARRIVHAQDTILATVRTYLKAVSYFKNPDPNTVVSTGFAVLSPIKEKIDPKYLYHQITAEILIQDVVANSSGVSYPAINPSQLGCLDIILPPLVTQKKIAAYLDEKTATIDEAIEKKRRQVELLKEKCAAMINRAVTVGLDSKIEQVDSEIPWPEQIPKGWRIYRLKFFCDFQSGDGFPEEMQGEKRGDLPFFKVSDINGEGKWAEEPSNFVSKLDALKMRWHPIPSGSIMMAKIGAALAKNHRKVTTTTSYIDNNTMAVSGNNKLVTGDYLYWLWKNIDLKDFQNISSVPSVNMGQVRGLRYPLPPKAEQQNITMYLDEKTAIIDQAVQKINRSIELLAEYKSSLITNIVTGKVAV